MEEKHPMKIIALGGNLPLAENMVKHLNTELVKANIERFADGEIRLNMTESVRGDNIYLIQSTSSPVNENYMELFIAIDALRRASAHQINVVMPYYGYARQDRKARSREPITARLMANILEADGISRVMTLDLHASQIQGFFNLPMDHLLGAPVLANHLLETHAIDENAIDDVVVVSPDHGGVARARELSNFLGNNNPIAIIDKMRPIDKKNTVEIMNIIGDVKGKTCVMIDDMIDTGNTIAKGAAALKEAGAKEVFVVATHAVLSVEAAQTLQNSVLDKVVLTDSINIPAEKHFDKLEIASVAELFARAINAVQTNTSVSPLFQKRFESHQ